uniref:RRP12-like protein n=1 Tax=Timema genevievae TaxID=629358 RepID=A0A7R9PH02_TIMGE|nr:unnamed protein product [Timema genevievae]
MNGLCVPNQVSAMLKSVSPQLSPSGAGSRVIRMSPDQEQTLEAQFSRVKNPHPTDLVLLAAETGLDERDVQVIVKSRVSINNIHQTRQLQFIQGLNTREFVLDSMLKLSFRYHSGRWGSTLFSGYRSKMGEQTGHVTIPEYGIIYFCFTQNYFRLHSPGRITDIMGKFRPRAKGKGKRWPKGQSSSSNPETKKYREIAKSRFFQENLGPRLLKGFRSDSALHKEMLAVLAAITEVIKANGGKESITEYFAALMTTLDACETEESITAVMSLLGMGLKKVPENVLKLKFPETSKTFCDLLGKFAETENSVILRSLLGCLSVLLRAQELAIWNNSSTLQVFNSVLAFATHSKPKVRKAAQHAVGSILKGSAIMLVSFPPPHHPAAVHTAKFCVQQVESGGSLGGSTTTLHALAFLQDVLSTFPKAQLKATCECILKMMTLGNLLVTSCSLQALHSLFASKPPALSMTPTLNGQLIAALYDYQPPANDTQPTLAWLSVMQEAHINLRRIDLPLCCSTLPRLFSTLTQLWMSEKPEIRNGTTLTLKAVILDCLPLACSPEIFPRNEQLLAKMFNTVENGLKYQYNLAWNHVLLVLAAMFETCGATCSKFMLPCLKSLADLRDSYKFSYTNELEHAVGKAVKSMGPEVVLQVIPLQITGEETSYEFKRSWLLPVLRENIEGSSLKFFMQYFLPLATACRKQSIALSEQNDQVGSHSYDLLQIQIWSLLPKFSTNPTDVKDNFKSIAKALGTAIAERKDLRVVVMSSLRRLIAWCQANKDEAGLSELARFSKNYVPILFNVYTTKPIGSDEEGQRLAAFETVKPRLRCLTHVVMKLEKCNSNMLQQIVPEAILCCKDINERCRTAAYNLLTEIGKAMQVKSLVGMTEDCKRHFRTKTRDILDRLVRKFGAENISVLVPASDIVMHKRLRNLRKIHSKKIRDKEQRKQENSDDDIDEPFIIKSYSKTIDEILAESDDSDLEDDEMLGKPGPSKKKKTKQVNAWIQEDEDNIMDFTDVAASRRITATNPKEAVIKEQKKSKNTGFKTAPDGRLIIVDTSDGEEERVKRVQRHLAPDSDDDIEEDQKSNTGIAMLSPMGRKRKLSVGTNAHSEPVMKYQAGGSGIHRPVKVAKKQKAKKKDLQGLTSGAVYRSKKAKGDMKRKGLPDPYAYVPLSRKMLSKSNG